MYAGPKIDGNDIVLLPNVQDKSKLKVGRRIKSRRPRFLIWRL